uniref:Protein kinase domain-containing protein n=1 Tax=Ananas comosus var. bracteatus TaxID=296719 RepID=A0A6V7QMJ8_ANACO|nr:unnamed protein product [Ananas comosus var. bracteatus]
MHESNNRDIESHAVLSSIKNVKSFSYNEIKKATNNFNQSNMLGRGGFGTVYKGSLKDGTPFAAKVLSTESKQGLKEFLTEIQTIANVRHENLVKLIGCCIQGRNRILVYEYLENNSLDQALQGFKIGKVKLNWGVRSLICAGTARGLAYLHEELEPHIVHRDIKASNILLDKNFIPKIGDFGLAKLFPAYATHISTRVVGTTGYLAPEYAVHGQLTKRADIYSFGVLLLEVISGRRISSFQFSSTDTFLVQWAWQIYEEDRLIDLVDPNLDGYPEEEVLRYIKVALFCTQAAAARRPSMPDVVEMLSKPMKLHDMELTPPHVVQDSINLSRGCGLSNSSNTKSNSLCPPTISASIMYSEVVPR